jgi:hypothetical protein
VGYREGGTPGSTSPDDHVSFDIHKHGNELAVVVGHEGVHVDDNYLANLGFPITHADTESFAWTVRSYLAQGLGMAHYPPGAVDSLTKYQVWNKGWRAAERETYRSTGVTNIVRDFYPDPEKDYLETNFP